MFAYLRVTYIVLFIALYEGGAYKICRTVFFYDPLFPRVCVRHWPLNADIVGENKNVCQTLRRSDSGRLQRAAPAGENLDRGGVTTGGGATPGAWTAEGGEGSGLGACACEEEVVTNT